MNCDRCTHTAVSRFLSGHLRSLAFQGGHKTHPICPNCNIEQASPTHILVCMGLSYDDLLCLPMLVYDFLRVVKVPRRFSTIERTRRLGNWTCLEVRALNRFLWAKNLSASDIHSQIVDVYGEEAMATCSEMMSGSHSFQSGRKDVKNRNMAGSGRPSSSTTEINTA
ncbi:histone-lysine N-methyltransferase SETMAR [Trichonephila clavipes]|nr:histone-lysine N-methyltransferase SETMAR [Trichonephila clavipes]